jgi:DNA invertase Pin-like site-specific DNA recombinase
MAERAGIWLRVSDNTQDEQNQEPETRRYCADHSYEVAETYTVHGKSAYHGEQDPDWQRVVNDVSEGKIQVVVIWKVDRFDRRNILHAIPMANAVLDVGGRIEFATQSIDLTTMPGRIAFATYCELAHEESKIKSDRINIKHAGLRAAGNLVGRPPFGYRIICAEGCGPVTGKHKHGKTLEPDPELAPYVLGMVDRFLSGETFTAICEWLEDDGIVPPNGGMWQLKTVRDILTNSALIGRRKNGKGRVVLRFPPILTDLTKWRALQHKLDSMPRKVNIAPDAAMLAGVVYCLKCNGVMHRRRVYNKRKDGSRQYNNYYRCDGTVRHHSTCKNMIPEAQLDAEVSDAMLNRHTALIARVLVPGQRDHADDIAEIDLEIDELDKGDPSYINNVATLIAERARLAALPATPDKWLTVQTGESYAQRWATLKTDAERREALAEWGIKVYAFKGSEPRIMWPEPMMSSQP